MREQAITVVVGPVSSGKSTWIVANTDPETHVLFRPGKMIRESAGVGFMARLPDPNAPALVDDLVVTLFKSLLRLANALGRPLVCDGFPRTAAQAVVMRDTCDLLGLVCNVDVVVLAPSAADHGRMLAGRGGDEFDKLRLARSGQDAAEVREFFNAIKAGPRFRCRVQEVTPHV